MNQLIPLIPFLPLIGFAINGLFGKNLSKTMVGLIGAGLLAWLGGPVILSWRHTLEGTLDDSDGENLVLHEFAHKLDMANGVIDGTPPMSSAEQAREWNEAMTSAREHLVESLRLGTGAPLRRYALTNPAEFFAVATECFFERPNDLDEWDPDLYRVLARWYRQDPRR